MSARTIQATDAHKNFRDSLIECIEEHQDDLTSEEMLALTAHFLGQLLAGQDRRTMSIDRAVATIQQNIEQGNLEAQEAAGVLHTMGRMN